MNVRTIAVPAAGFSAVLSLLTLNVSAPIGISFSKALTSSDVFNVYGTLDSAAADATNATSIGRVAGTSGGNLDPELIQKMLMWPGVLLERVSGAGVGTFEACGNLDAAPAVASTALPAIGAFSALLDMTAFQSTVRIGTSRQQLIGDVFDVYVTNDSTINPAVTGTDGAWYAGRIAGGGERSGLLSSLVVQGFGYAFLKRVTGATAGNMLASGSSVPATSGTAWLIGGNTLPAGTQILGTLNAGATLSVRAGGNEIINSDGSKTAIGNTNATVPGNTLFLQAGAGGIGMNADGGGAIDISVTGAGGLSINTDTGPINIGTSAVVKAITIGNGTGATQVTIDVGTGDLSLGTNATVHDVNIGSSTGASSVAIVGGTGGVGVGSNAIAQPITIGNNTGTTSVDINVGTGACNVGANATDHATTIGSVTVASLTTIQGGTSGVVIQPAATGPLTAMSGTSGAATFDSGSTGAVHIGDGASAKAVTVGSITGAASLAIRAGTGGLTIVNNGVTWTWPTALGAAGSKLTDAAGNGILSFA